MKQLHNFFKDKTVFLTGHTGFKGSWLSLWLQTMGSNVIGYSLEPPTNPNMFETCDLKKHMVSIIGDVRDYDNLYSAVKENKPDIVFHLAAQALVLESYTNPLETVNTNVIGTLNILNIVKEQEIPVLVNITSDKCYENKEDSRNFKETDKLGGNDLYSASKACSEILSYAFSKSFFDNTQSSVIGTVRAGNVIGGGDWSRNRLLPDCFRSLNRGEKILIRNPNSIRPWQHVLEPLLGYMFLSEKLYKNPAEYKGAWNFGPPTSQSKNVLWIAERICDLWPLGGDIITSITNENTEAQILNLDSSKSIKNLNWKPRLDIEKALKYTTDWYSNYFNSSEDIRDFTIKQIVDYENGI